MKLDTVDDVMVALKALGSETTKRTLMRHGAPEPIIGVKIGDMKPLHKLLKGKQELAMGLYATGCSDAMYLAGMIADGGKMTRAELNQWVKQARWAMISGTTLPWVLADHAEGFDIAEEWADSEDEWIAVAGWSGLAGVVSCWEDDHLPIKRIQARLRALPQSIPIAKNRVKYAMNGFLIACGTYVAPLAQEALSLAERIGQVVVDMGDTACQVPEAASYILKSRKGAPVAPKRKTIRC